MSKRSFNGIAGVGKVAKQPKKHWSFSLLETMKDPKFVYKKSERVVIIRDKYPKAKVHLLLLPNDNINSIYDLNKSHINLLEEFGKLYEDIKLEHKSFELRAGFHAVPSMQRLHMHVISTDMISACLKTKIHWNSFTTDNFIIYEDLLTQLKNDGLIKRLSHEKHKEIMATPLKCNQCDYIPKNMPSLKQHLLKHDA